MLTSIFEAINSMTFNAEKLLKHVATIMIFVFVAGFSIMTTYVLFYDKRDPENCSRLGGVFMEGICITKEDANVGN